MGKMESLAKIEKYQSFFISKRDALLQVGIPALRLRNILIRLDSIKVLLANPEYAEKIEELWEILDRHFIKIVNTPINKGYEEILSHDTMRFSSTLAKMESRGRRLEEKAYNSKEYYESKIQNLTTEKDQLEQNIRTLLKNKNQTDEIRREKELQEAELEKAKVQILKLSNELETKIKQENAIEEWEEKIKRTFETLNTKLEPLKQEHNRLKCIFGICAGITIAVLLFLCFIEFAAYCKIRNAAGFPDFKDYIILFLPIPIAGAILWASVYQTNRSQRQLVFLAKQMHEIEYVEGLLLTINSLSSNIEQSVDRINGALDKLLDLHLRCGSYALEISEKDLIDEERKDKNPYDYIYTALREIKDIVSEN